MDFVRKRPDNFGRSDTKVTGYVCDRRGLWPRPIIIGLSPERRTRILPESPLAGCYHGVLGGGEFAPVSMRFVTVSAGEKKRSDKPGRMAGRRSRPDCRPPGKRDKIIFVYDTCIYIYK